MLPSKEVTIQGTQYRIILQPSKIGRPMLLELSKLLSQGADRAALMGSDAALLTGAVLALTEADLTKHWQRFQDKTEVMASEGYVPLSVAWPEEQGGLTDYGLMLELIEAHVEANFSSFFAVARAKYRAQVQASASPSPKK